LLQSWKIGDVRVSSLVEYFGPTHDPEMLYPDYELAMFEAAAATLPPARASRPSPTSS
jgi:hypothetical protein